MSLKLTDILTGFFFKKVGKKTTHYFVCMIPLIAVDPKCFENDDHRVDDNLDYLIESEKSFEKANEKAKELEKSFSNKRYDIMVVEITSIKRR